jgi:hypothetical protein
MAYRGPVDTLGVLWPNTVSCSLFEKKESVVLTSSLKNTVQLCSSIKTIIEI